VKNKLRLTATTSANVSNGWQSDISIDNFGITSDLATVSAALTAVCQNINFDIFQITDNQ
jgi:hypothetical protein